MTGSPLLNSPGPIEERLWGLFGAVSWKPFRAVSDLVRTALETTFTARTAQGSTNLATGTGQTFSSLRAAQRKSSGL